MARVNSIHVFLRAAPRNNLLPNGPIKLVKNNIIAIMDIAVDYRLSFDIVPNGIVNGSPASILHFSAGSDCCSFGQRTPAFWFAGTRLQYRVGDITNGDFGSEINALPLNVPTKVTLECKGKNVKLTLGENSVASALTQPTNRFAGKVIVYAGDPWYPAAEAVISNLHYEKLHICAASAGKVMHHLDNDKIIENGQACSIITHVNTIFTYEIYSDRYCSE